MTKTLSPSGRRLTGILLAALAICMPVVSPAQETTTRKDVVYGVAWGSGLLADLTWPQGRTNLPVILMVHGGRWRAGSKNDANYAKGPVFAAAGFFTMSIDYRLIDASPQPAGYQDVFTAIRWLHAHAAEYSLDEKRIYVIGNSSGGHDAALAATLGAGPFPKTGGWDTASSEIAGAIAISGAYDLNHLSWGNLWTPLTGDANTGFTTLSGAALEEARRTASPLAQVNSQTRPMLFLASEDDKIVPFQQAVDFDRAMTAAGVFHKFVRYTDKGHMGFTDETIRQALTFIAELEARH